MSTGLRFTLEVDGLPPDAFAVVSFSIPEPVTLFAFFPRSLSGQPAVSLP